MTGPKWLTEDYPENEQDVAADIQAAFYQSLSEGLTKEQQNDMDIMAQVNTKAILGASKHARKLEKTMGRAAFALAWQVVNKQLYHFDGEIETVAQWLFEQLPSYEQNSSAYYDSLFILQEFFPMIQKLGNGWSVKKLLSLEENWSRTREAIPFMRNAVDRRVAVDEYFEEEMKTAEKQIGRLEKKLEKEKDSEVREELTAEINKNKLKIELLGEQQPDDLEKADKKLTKEIDKALKVIIDPGVSVHGPQGVRNTLKGKIDWKIEAFKGIAIIDGDVPTTKTVFLIVVDKGDEGIINSCLRDAVDVRDTDPAVILHQINELFPK